MIENINIAITFMNTNNIFNAKCSPQDFIDGNQKAIHSIIYRLYLVANGRNVVQQYATPLSQHSHHQQQQQPRKSGGSFNQSTPSHQIQSEPHHGHHQPQHNHIQQQPQQHVPALPTSPSPSSSSLLSMSHGSGSESLVSPRGSYREPRYSYSSPDKGNYSHQQQQPVAALPQVEEEVVQQQEQHIEEVDQTVDVVQQHVDEHHTFETLNHVAIVPQVEDEVVQPYYEQHQSVVVEEYIHHEEEQHIQPHPQPLPQQPQPVIYHQPQYSYVAPVAPLSAPASPEHEESLDDLLLYFKKQENVINAAATATATATTSTTSAQPNTSVAAAAAQPPSQDPADVKWKRRLTERPASGTGFNIGRARINTLRGVDVSSSADSTPPPASPTTVGTPIPASVKTPVGRTDSNGSIESLSSSPMKAWSVAKVVNENDKRKKPLLLKPIPIDLERYNNPELLPSIIKSQSYVRRWIAMHALHIRIKQNNHRNKCFKEILSTEENYVAAIEMIVNVFYQQILWNSKVSPNPYLTQEDISTIFSTVNEIYIFNKELLARVRERAKQWNSYQKIGDIFVEMAPYMKVLYKAYCLNYDTAIECLQKAKKNEMFNLFIKACLDHPENPMKQSLETLLITIVQRIPRYILLIQDMNSNTWHDHIDRDNLRAALKLIQSAAGEVNTSIKMAESQSKVLEIQRSLIGWDESTDLVNPSRHFIKQGIIYKCQLDSRFAKDREELAYFAFNDSLLVVEKRDSTKYQFKYFFELAKTRVKDVEDSQVLQNAIHIIHGETTAMFAFDTPRLKGAIIEFIEKGKVNKRMTTALGLADYASTNNLDPAQVGEGPFNVQIKKTESKKLPGKKPFTVYIIDIVNEGTGEVSSLSKRYSDFDHLHKKLKKKFPDTGIRDLPKKHLLNNLGTNTVESRRVMLEVFLQDLFQKELLKNSELLLKFIRPTEPELQKSMSSSSLNESMANLADSQVPSSPDVSAKGIRQNDFIDYDSEEDN
ncbi:hypothetical protein SAMD00019534_065370 [Acytostelium subglobosum LB1]|uniref:hypothetical protein n=1 Tax=Acytostelium subglobosum LB1 TaxID=1410327 RepID=UPI000644A3FC|nr:hypothetical protein SAMD00019534_065370 [Acytostelium subglobosum LB1]GAM23362.1 hypothetical protein SAMD00019534_065370 [Acytostelium subglobosum LB1]|eukprot:XP_012753811.1 hypothetical protein SAMD00019534_065370 [Acytostelium subglobosum LB1]